MQLYKLVDNLKFLEEIDPDDDSHQARLSEMIAQVKLDIDTKVANIGLYILSIETEASAISVEEKRLTRRRKALENRSQWLRDYLYSEMRASMVRNVKSELCTVYIKANPPSCEVLDVYELPKEYTNVLVSPDRVAILDHFKKTGEILPGVNIITDRESIVVR